MDSNGDETPPLSTLPPPRPKSEPPPPPPPKSRPSPVLREDCWSEDATRVLVEAWGSRHLSLNRGHLRQHHWQEVAATVNAAVSAAGKANLRRTHVQCKNRIDTLKKKYKIEKYKSRRTAAYVSPWPFFSRLDFLISGTDGGGGESPSSDSPPPLKTPTPPPPPPPAALTNFPVGRRSAKQKRPAPINNSFFSRNFAPVTASSEERESSQGTSSGGGGGGGGGGGRRREREEVGFGSGCRELAKAIRRFGEVYERVEVMKQEQLIEVEKHRMQFAKDLEFQRMKLLMDTQLQLARIKRSKHSDAADSYL